MRRLALLLVPLVFLAGCGGDDSGAGSSSTPSSSSPEPVRTGETPVVTGAFGEKPTVKIPNSDPGNQLVSDVLVEGDGVVLAENDLVVADYSAWAWRPAGSTYSPDPSTTVSPDGSFDSTFGTGSPLVIPLSTSSLLPGMLNGLVGKKVGSRVLIVVPPDQGFGADGSDGLGIGPDDSMIFVFDLIQGYNGTAAADGTPVAVTDPSLPTVADSDKGPTITIPPGVTPPTDLVTQVLLQGDGPAVQAGQAIVAQYRGVIWKDGSEFDSSWAKGQVASFTIGTGAVIPGWDRGLVGQKVGSRILLIVPPDEGYGSAGQSDAGIAGDDTLVFVVDILGTYGNPT